MHPADEIEAFRALIEAGQCAADVAARFGVSENVVQQRLALARVSPSLLQRYRDGEMNLETLKAFTLTDDHTAQFRLTGWRQFLNGVDKKLACITCEYLRQNTARC